MATIIEPFRIKAVEPLKMTTLDERRQILARADWNLFRVRAEEDRDFDGNMDVWTIYAVSHGKEVVERIEKATKGSGPPEN